jgi:threonine synthase
LKKEIESGRLDARGKQVVVVCTGHGMKDPGIITRDFSYQTLPSDIKEIEKIILRGIQEGS